MEKKKVSIGPVDILMIISVALVVVLIAVMFFTQRDAVIPTNQTTEILFTVELERKKDGFQDNIKVGDKLYDSVKGLYLGDITDVSVLPYESSVQDKINGVYKVSPVEGMVLIQVTAKMNATITDKETTVNGVDIAVGKETFIRTETFASRGFGIGYEKIA